MDKSKVTMDGASKSKIALLIIVALLAIFILSDTASAALTDSFRNMGSSIGGYFNNYASDNNPQFLDFLIFSIIFIAVCWIGFSTAFKDGKNANIALAGAVGLALSIALVYGGKFTVKKLLPFAAIILFILCLIGIYSLLKKFVFTKDTIVSKILSVVFAILITIALFALALNMICSGSSCENNAFMRKLFGSESIFGKIFTGAGSIFSGWGGQSLSPTRSGTTGPAISRTSIGLCGNGVKDIGEACDIGKDKQSNIGCSSGYLCNNCDLCEKQSTAGAIIDHLTSYWYIYLLLGILLGFLLTKRKTVTEKVKKEYKAWRERRKQKKERKVLNRLLNRMVYVERELSSDVRQLVENVKQEKTPFEASRHIIDGITKDIKETVGGEIQLIEAGAKEGLFDKVKSLHNFNNHEKVLVEAKILPNIKREVDIIREEMSADKKVIEQLNQMENVGEQFQEHAALLNDFKRYNFREKGIIDNMLRDLAENETKFVELKGNCDTMIALLDDEMRKLHTIQEGKLNYATIVEHIKMVRTDAIKLNNIFITKINTLRYIVAKMEEIKHHIHELHDAEIENLNDFLTKAVEAKGQGKFDTSLYFAMHVVENAKFLEHIELGAEAKARLKTLEDNAVELIKTVLPEVFPSVKDKLEDELLQGRYVDVKRTLTQLKNVEFIFNKEKESKLSEFIKAHRERILQIEELCDSMKSVAEKRKIVEDLITSWAMPPGGNAP